MATKLKKFTQAEYLPTHEVIPLLEVEPEQHTGPWRCPTPNCIFQLHYKRGFLRVRNGRSFPVSPHWSGNSNDSNEHALHCDVSESSSPSVEYWSKSLKQFISRSQTVLLTFGQHTKHDKATTGASAEGGQPTEYAGRAGTLAQILRAFINAGGHEGMGQYFYTHDSVQYLWQQIAYSSSTIAYQRLLKTRTELRWAQENWPWVIAGTVGKAGFLARNGERLGINLYPANEFGQWSSIKVTGYCDNNIEGHALLQRMTPGTQVLTLMHQV